MKILLLSAVPAELEPFKRAIGAPDHQFIHRHGGITVESLPYRSHELHLACTGVGTSYAGLAMGTLTPLLNPDFVIFLGTAGGTADHVNIGDIVIANEAVDVDIHNLHEELIGTPFESSLINPNNQRLIPKGYSPQKIPTLPSFTNIHQGRVGSTNFFPAPEFIYQTIKSLNILCLDMESSAIYQAGNQLGINTLVIRAISNLINSDGKDPDIANSNPDLAGNRLAEFTVKLLEM